MSWLILKALGALSRPSGQWRDDDYYDVLENGSWLAASSSSMQSGRKGRPWMWASGHNGDIRRAVHGYELTREPAMAAFAKSWRRE